MNRSNTQSDGGASAIITVAHPPHETRAQQVAELVVTTTTSSGGAITERPQKTDVLLGRGRGQRMHCGNLRYEGGYRLQ